MNNLMANWPAPSNIRALTTTRTDGFSKAIYESNNLALHVGDNEHHVIANRDALKSALQLPNEPIWLKQTHSNLCVTVEDATVSRLADAAVTRNKAYPLAILTGDCLPIVLCNREGSEIAAIHAGWRGLMNGVIENTLHQLTSDFKDCMAWIGPAICQSCYETGDDVFKAFTDRYPFTQSTFHQRGPLKKYHANLAKMAELVLNNSGVLSVYHSNVCTFEQKNNFYSYRRDGETGRMATLIWFLG